MLNYINQIITLMMKILSLKFKLLLAVVVLLPGFTKTFAQRKHVVDVCIYGGTSAGVIAAYTAGKSGKKVLLIEPGKHLGGMSSGGLGYTDIGNKYVVTGLSRDFYRRIGQHYQTFEQWKFEPKVAEEIFNQYVKAAGLEVVTGYRLLSVKKSGNKLNEITIENSERPSFRTHQTVQAKIFIDCSYEGDLMAKSGVSYTVGREDNTQYGETFNGVQLLDGHQLPDGIDPYVKSGDPSSGLVWGVFNRPLQANGKGDKKIQAYNFRITLTNVPENRSAITKPANYKPERYELLLRMMEKKPWKSLKDGFIWSLMPNGKTDINNRGGFSTDMIGMNWDYPEGSYQVRAKIWQDHIDYTKGLLYFVGNDTRIPVHIRTEMREWGYPKDEFKDTDNWPHQLYIREARRMIGELVMTQHHCEGKEVVRDGIAMAAYTMDSHNCDRQVIDGMAKNEGNIEKGGFDPYPISYRSIVPQRKEAANLLVPVCMSASHIAYGSIRMEPVFMVMAQSAALAACLAIDQQIPVQMVNADKIAAIVKANPLMDGSIPEILVDNDDPAAVEIKGEWTKMKRGGYGPTFLSSLSAPDKAKSVRFIPEIKQAASYHVFSYFSKLTKAAAETRISVFDGKQVREKRISADEIQVEGQSSGGWVALGTVDLERGKSAYVEITNEGHGGVIVADAVLFVPLGQK